MYNKLNMFFSLPCIFDALSMCGKNMKRHILFSCNHDGIRGVLHKNYGCKYISDSKFVLTLIQRKYT